MSKMGLWPKPHNDGPLLDPLLSTDANPPALVAMSHHTLTMSVVAWSDSAGEASASTLYHRGGELSDLKHCQILL